MRILVVIASIAAFATAFESCGKKGFTNRIINGLPAAHGEFPWQVSFRHALYNVHFCGGTLIGPRWVLSAAQCFLHANNPSELRVRVGEWHQNSNDGTEIDIEIAMIITHEAYPHQIFLDNDIALIKLAKEVNFTTPYVGPACLPKFGEDYHGADGCWFSGWGLIKPPASTPVGVMANTLQKLQGKIWTDADLKADWSDTIRPGIIGFGTNRRSACMGDSGGPLVCPSKSIPGRYAVVGIFITGSASCQDHPGLFTEVTHYLDWINDRMQMIG